MKNTEKGEFSNNVIMGIRKREDYTNTATLDMINGFEFYSD
jgi:hypothetical protein